MMSSLYSHSTASIRNSILTTMCSYKTVVSCRQHVRLYINPPIAFPNSQKPIHPLEIEGIATRTLEHTIGNVPTNQAVHRNP
jgi:hypothetical protein